MYTWFSGPQVLMVNGTGTRLTPVTYSKIWKAVF